VVAGVSRFLAVESCGQCTPCKQGGLALSQLLERLSRNDAQPNDLEAMNERIATVADGARCYLASQQEVVVSSLVHRFGDAIDAHMTGAAAAIPPAAIAELVDIVDGSAIVDERHRDKQPDWTFDAAYSGQAPADRLGEHRSPQALED
jgi:hypothetical protein